MVFRLLASVLPFMMPGISSWQAPCRMYSIVEFGARADGSKCTTAFDLWGDPISPVENGVIERVSPGLSDGDLLTSENVRGSLDGRPLR